MKEPDKNICPGCGGSGQISFFQGESRFLLTMEECSECNGTGILPEKKNKRNKKQPKNTDEDRK